MIRRILEILEAERGWIGAGHRELQVEQLGAAGTSFVHSKWTPAPLRPQEALVKGPHTLPPQWGQQRKVAGHRIRTHRDIRNLNSGSMDKERWWIVIFLRQGLTSLPYHLSPGHSPRCTSPGGGLLPRPWQWLERQNVQAERAS